MVLASLKAPAAIETYNKLGFKACICGDWGDFGEIGVRIALFERPLSRRAAGR